MSRHSTVGSILGLPLLLVASVACAESHPCAGITDGAQRLACYDRTFGAPAANVAAGPMGAAASVTAAIEPAGDVPVADIAADADKARKEFGLSEEAKRGLNEDKATPAPPESITATVREVTRRPHGEQMFDLDNGQVWVEIEGNTRARAKAGEVVTIRKASLGSYMLVTSSKVATHVRRVQ